MLAVSNLTKKYGSTLANEDLNFTLALSLIAVFTVQFTGIATLGIIKYGKKFFVSPLHKPYCIGTAVGILELVS